MKMVLISGAGRGIGLALTKEFMNNGFHVVATYRDEKKAPDLLRLASTSSSITTVKVDVTDENSFLPLKDLLGKSKPIDILINNSGIIGSKASSILGLDMETMNEVLQVNTLGPMRLCQVAFPFLSRNATIAQITSSMGSIGTNEGGYYDYRVSKAALNMFNSCLAKEFPEMTCLVLHPGWVQTEMGGSSAPVKPENSAQGLYKVITGSTQKQSGSFFDFEGKTIPW